MHHSFAHDFHIHMSPPDKICMLHQSMQSFTSERKAWATANMLELNDDKREIMLVTLKRTKHLHNLLISFTTGNAQLSFKQSVNNFSFSLDCHHSMNEHISTITRTCYFEFCLLAFIRRFLTNTATATLVFAFILLRIDYCNWLLFGSAHDVSSCLQRMQKNAARVILCIPKSDNISIR